MNIPRDLSIAASADEFKFSIGEHDLSNLPVSTSGPIVECLTPGVREPMFVVWIPVMFEGAIDDPGHVLRIVHDGEAEKLMVGENGDK